MPVIRFIEKPITASTIKVSICFIGTERAKPSIRRSDTISDPRSRQSPKKWNISKDGQSQGSDIMNLLSAVPFSQ